MSSELVNNSYKLQDRKEKLPSEKMYLAEIISDYIASESDDKVKKALSKIRFNEVCQYSPTGEHLCNVNTLTTFSCDTCLQDELYNLWRCGIQTIGSCCGHGVKTPYIQVLQGDSIKKMLENGYKPLLTDRYGNGQNCFEPKTFLPSYEAEQALKERD